MGLTSSVGYVLVGLLALVALASPVAGAPLSVLPIAGQSFDEVLEQARAELRRALEQAEAARQLAGRRAYLGLTIEQGQGHGVRVLAVTPDGPAERAGVKAGDVLETVAGVSLGEVPLETLRSVLQSLEPGERIEFTLKRAGQTQTVSIEVGDSGAMFAVPDGVQHFASVPARVELSERLSEAVSSRLGLGGTHRWDDLELASVNAELGRYFGTARGILVVSAGERSKPLQGGDVILKIGTRAPQSPAHLWRILRSYMSGETVSLTIMRDQREEALEIPLP